MADRKKAFEKLQQAKKMMKEAKAELDKSRSRNPTGVLFKDARGYDKMAKDLKQKGGEGMTCEQGAAICEMAAATTRHTAEAINKVSNKLTGKKHVFAKQKAEAPKPDGNAGQANALKGDDDEVVEGEKSKDD